MFKPVDANHDFIAMEKKWLKHWYENGVVDKYLHKNKKSKKYQITNHSVIFLM